MCWRLTPTCSRTDWQNPLSGSLLVTVLRKTLQPDVPGLCAGATEQVVDDEELQVDGARKVQVQMTRPVVRPLDLDAVVGPLRQSQRRKPTRIAILTAWETTAIDR